MPQTKLTPTESACASFHAQLLEAVQLRERLLALMDDAEDHLDVDRGAGLRWDRLWRVLDSAERRVVRRRLRWLDAQRLVFADIAASARELSPSQAARESVDRLSAALDLAYARASRWHR